MNKSFYVYVHSRLNTGQPFYIGKGRADRAYTRRSRSTHWKNIVAKDDGCHVNFICENVDEELAFLIEMESIDKYRRLGVKLINMTNGGEGPTGYKFTDSQRSKISNRTITPEWRERMSASAKGRKLTPEQRAEMSARMKADPRVKARGMTTSFKGRKHTAESRAKMSVGMKGRIPSNKGKPMLAHVRAALIEAQSKRTNFAHSEETKRKIGASHKGRKVSPETKAMFSKMRRISVRCIDTGEIFDCALSAAQHFGCRYRTLVGQCCRGVIKSAHGHAFEYVERKSG